MIALIGDAKDKEGRVKHFTSIRNISGATRYRRTKIDGDKDLAFLVYSSGTTGKLLCCNFGVGESFCLTLCFRSSQRCDALPPQHHRQHPSSNCW
jgi:hypothetical protein